jgi:hypothetical protein
MCPRAKEKWSSGLQIAWEPDCPQVATSGLAFYAVAAVKSTNLLRTPLEAQETRKRVSSIETAWTASWLAMAEQQTPNLHNEEALQNLAVTESPSCPPGLSNCKWPAAR